MPFAPLSMIYDAGRELFLSGSGDFDAQEFRVIPVDATYQAQVAHVSLADVGAGSRCASPQTLAGKTTTGGVASANDVTFPAVAAGKTIVGFVVYKYNATESLATLLCYINNDSLGGPISIVTNGGDVVIRFGGGTKSICRI